MSRNNTDGYGSVGKLGNLPTSEICCRWNIGDSIEKQEKSPPHKKNILIIIIIAVVKIKMAASAFTGNRRRRRRRFAAPATAAAAGCEILTHRGSRGSRMLFDCVRVCEKKCYRCMCRCWLMLMIPPKHTHTVSPCVTTKTVYSLFLDRSFEKG